MTEQGQPESAFNQRADNASLRLRQDLIQHGAEIPEQGAVAVGPDGQPPQPLPPPGSYARQAIDQQRAQGQPRAENLIGTQPPAGTLEQVVDGSQAPPLPAQPQQAQPQEHTPEVSQRAEQRIRELSAQLREKDGELQNIRQEAKSRGASFDALQEKFALLQQQQQQLLQSNLDNLDPETRLQVITDARIQEQMVGLKTELMQEIMPHVQSLQGQNVNAQFVDLAGKYPRFDVQIHRHLVEERLATMPALSVEQAWLLVAEDDERVIRAQPSGAAVPPVLPAGSGHPVPRYVPTPTSQTTPEQEVADELAQASELMRSGDPAKHREAMRAFSRNIDRRVFGDRQG